MSPHIAVSAAVVLRFLKPTAELCEMQIGCLSVATFVGWLLVVNYLMLERRVGPFFIMVSEMIARDFVRFMVIPLTILPAFAITFNTSVALPALSLHCSAVPRRCEGSYSLLVDRIFRFNRWTSGSQLSAPQVTRAEDAHGNFGQSVFTLVLMGVGLGDETMFGGFGGSSDSRVMVLLLLYILLVPILSLNLLVAMMADTYIDVRSASLNRWSLKQAQYVLSRQKYAELVGRCALLLFRCASVYPPPRPLAFMRLLGVPRRPVHFPVMDAGYAFSGHYDQFFTGTGEEEATVENLRKATLEEARRSARLAEVAVEGIAGLTEVLSGQISELAAAVAATQRFAKESSISNAGVLQHMSNLSPTKRS